MRRGDFLLRYDEEDDFGLPETAFLVCTLWWILALAQIGEQREGARLFERCWTAAIIWACWRRTWRRRAANVGQLPADLQHGRPDPVRGPPLDFLGRRLLMERP